MNVVYQRLIQQRAASTCPIQVAWIKRMVNLSCGFFGVTEAELKVIDDEVKAIVQDSADFAQESPEPPESELMTDILVEAN